MTQSEVLEAFQAPGIKAAICCCSRIGRTASRTPARTFPRSLKWSSHALKYARPYGGHSVCWVPCVVTTGSYATPTNALKANPQSSSRAQRVWASRSAIEKVGTQFPLSPLEAAHYIDEFDKPARLALRHRQLDQLVIPRAMDPHPGPSESKLHVKNTAREARLKPARLVFSVAYLTGDNDWPTVMQALDDTRLKHKPSGASRASRRQQLECLKTTVQRNDQILCELTMSD